MFQQIIVPVDGSDRSWAAARVGATIANAVVADLLLVHAVIDDGLRDHARKEIEAGLETHPALAVQPEIVPLVSPANSDGEPGPLIASYAESLGGSMVVMSSTGRGRSAAVLGSVADDVLGSMYGPIIVVGPHVTDVDSFSGDIVVPVDGSTFSETMLPIAAAWGIALGAVPWVVEVLDGPVPAGADVFESSYAHRLARDLETQTHHEVEYEVLHGDSPAHAIADFGARRGARLIMMSTHGRTGLKRLRAGSTAAGVVRASASPVVLHRPAVFALD